MKVNHSLLIPFTSLLLLFHSCTPENRIFDEHQELSPEVEWLKSDTKTFTVNIEDNSVSYNLQSTFRYITGYPFESALVKLTITSPSGSEKTTEHEFKLRDENGDYVGTPGLDIWDSEHTLFTSYKFEETGTYEFTFEHNMPVEPFTHVLDIGLIIDKNI